MTAIVAGAGPGIGRACAAALRREGADVVVAARDAARLEAMASEMTSPTRHPPGPQVLPIAFDFADLASCRALVDETLARLGRIDILVNVATAGGETTPIAEGEWESWRRAFEVNVIGTLELSRLAAQAMTPTRAAPSFRSAPSGPGRCPRAGPATRPRRAPWSPPPSPWPRSSAASNVRVNVVTPGFTTGAPLDAMIESIATRTGESPDEVSARMAAGASLRRHVDPEDVAEAVVFLAGPGARNITGIELPVTAGR